MVIWLFFATLLTMPLLETVLSLFAPHYCCICGREGRLMCEMCVELEIRPVPSRCYRCQKATREAVVCVNCRRAVALRHVWVRTIYEGWASKLILWFKFERSRAAYAPIAHALTTVLPFLPSDTLIIGVPTATSRVRQRGYDHIRLVTRELSRLTGFMHAAPVVRSGQSHQFGASRAKRLVQLRNNFHVVDTRLVAGKRVLLVDDVLTTGATLETLAEVLKNAGALQVDAVVFAQKL